MDAPGRAPPFLPFALAAAAVLAFFRPGSASAQSPGGPAGPRARCELDSSGLFSVVLDGYGDRRWKLSLLAPVGGIPGGRAVPPIAFRTGFALGPLLCGSISPPEELVRLKDPLSRSACPALDAKPPSACAVGLDGRDISSRAKPGIQEIPGAALDLAIGLPGGPQGTERSFRLKAGAFPTATLPFLGLSASYASSSDAKRGLSIEADIQGIAAPGRRSRDATVDDPWFLDAGPALPPDAPFTAGLVSAALSWGPLGLCAGLSGSGALGRPPVLQGDSGLILRAGGFSLLAGASFPLATASPRPLFAMDGLPSGRAKWAPAGIRESWRWEAAWEGAHIQAAIGYEGFTGRALATERDCLPRRERAEAIIGYEGTWPRLGMGGRAEASRILDWRADGRAQARNAADLAADLEFFPWNRKARERPSFSIGADFTLWMEEERAPGPGREGAFLIALPGRMPILRHGTDAGLECRARSKDAGLKLRVGMERGAAPELSLAAEASLPGGRGRLFLAIGPGEEASIGWKNR